MFKIKNNQRVSFVLSVFLTVSFLVSCTPSGPPEQPSLTPEVVSSPFGIATESASIPATLTATHTPTVTVDFTKTLTPSPTVDIQALLSNLTIDEERLQFAAIRRLCRIPDQFTLDELEARCVNFGTEQGEFINFGRISQYDRMRIMFAISDGLDVTEPFIEHTMLLVYKYEQDQDYTDSDPLYEIPLFIDEDQPDSFFVDLDLLDLERTQLIAFYLVLQGYQEIVYRTDQILFYEASFRTATPDIILPTEAEIPIGFTNTPLPTATQVLPTSTLVPTATQLPPPTATQTRPPTSTPIATMRPSLTPSLTPRPG